MGSLKKSPVKTFVVLMSWKQEPVQPKQRGWLTHLGRGGRPHSGLELPISGVSLFIEDLFPFVLKKEMLL